MHNFKKLKVWVRSKDLAIKLYNLTQKFPKGERFGLINQIQRAAVSVPSNIAEGCGRNSDRQLVQFLQMAMGSLTELETQLIICEELNFITNKDFENLDLEIDEIQKMLRVLIQKKSNI